MESGNAKKIFEEPLKTEGGSRSRWPAIGISRLLLNKMQDSELLKYALEHGMINMSYVQEQMEMNKRKEMLEKHPYAIWKGKDGKWRTYSPARSIF